MKTCLLLVGSLALSSCSNSSDKSPSDPDGGSTGGKTSESGGSTGSGGGSAAGAGGGAVSNGGANASGGASGGSSAGGVRATGASDAGGDAASSGGDGGPDADGSPPKLDTLPDAFTIANVFGVLTGSSNVSPTVTVSGFDGEVPVTVTGPGASELRINGTNVGALTGMISAGDTLAIRVTAAPANLTIVTTTVTVGQYTTAFDVTTGGACTDFTPSSFSLEGVANQAPGSIALFETRGGVRPTGYSCETLVTVKGPPGSNPQVGIWQSLTMTHEPWGASVKITPGQYVAVRATAPAFGKTSEIQLTIGGVTGTWTVASCRAGECMTGAIGANPGCGSPATRVVSWRCEPGGIVYQAGDFTYQFGGTGLLTAPAGAVDIQSEACGGNGWSAGTLACP